MGADFPSIQKPAMRINKFRKAFISTEFEAGYRETRRQDTKGRNVWRLQWDYLPKADRDTLKSHFDENVGDTFTCSADMLGETSDYIVRYSQAEIEFTPVRRMPGLYEVTIQLEEK